MNKQRRKAITAIGTRLEKLDIAGMRDEIESMKEDLEALKGEEEEYLENMNENLKGGDKGQTAEQAISAMESIGEKLDAAKDALDELEGVDVSEATA